MKDYSKYDIRYTLVEVLILEERFSWLCLIQHQIKSFEVFGNILRTNNSKQFGSSFENLRLLLSSKVKTLYTKIGQKVLNFFISCLTSWEVKLFSSFDSHWKQTTSGILTKMEIGKFLVLKKHNFLLKK